MPVIHLGRNVAHAGDALLIRVLFCRPQCHCFLKLTVTFSKFQQFNLTISTEYCEMFHNGFMSINLNATNNEANAKINSL